MKKALFISLLTFSLYCNAETSQNTNGNNSPAISNIDGNVTIDNSSNINIYEKNKENESDELELPKNEKKKVPHKILEYISLGAPMSRVREILGTPFRKYSSGYSLFSDKTFDSKVNLYRFENFDMAIESDDGESVSVITIQLSFNDDDSTVDIPPFSDTSIGKIEIGKSKIKDLADHCDFRKAEFIQHSKDAYFAMECYFGNLGNYYYFTFGSYGLKEDWEEIKDGKLIVKDETKPNIKSNEIHFISIAGEENRGHNIDYRDFR